MSKSPKYTTAHLSGPSEAELARMRQERERERKRMAEQARRQRQEAERAAIEGELRRLRMRTEAGAADAVATGLDGRRRALLDRIGALAAQSRAAGTDHELRAAREQLEEVRQEADGLAVAAAGILATRQRERALDALRKSLADVPDRAELDAAGAEETSRLFSDAERQIGDPAGFGATYARLTSTAQAHLSRAHARRAELTLMREQAAAASAAVLAVLEEARQGEIALDGAADAQRLLARLSAAVQANDAALARSLSEQAQEAGRNLAEAFDRSLDQLERTNLVFRAIVKALPQAGLTVLGDSLQTTGTSARIRVLRADKSPIDVIVAADDADGVQIEYRVDGADFTVVQTAEGEAAQCPDTETLIEQLHDELTAWGVTTGELLWEGKPGTRPDRKREEAYWQRDVLSRDRR